MIIKAANIKRIYPQNLPIKRIIRAAKTAWIATFVQVQSFIDRVTAAGGSYEDNGALEAAVVNEVRNIPSLVVTPNAIAPGKLFSLYPEDGTGDFTVDRASTATYVGADGLIKIAPANVPRIDHSTGEPNLLLEGQNTNLFTYSSAGDLNGQNSGVWLLGGVNETFQADVAPDGTMTALRLEGNGEPAVPTRYLEAPAGGICFSVFIKVLGTASRPLAIRNDTTGITLTSVQVYPNGTIGASSNRWRVESYVNGWVRVSGYATEAEVPAGNLVRFYFGATGITEGNPYLIWGAQAEAGTRASSYIPTEGSTVTRLKDMVYQNSSLPSGINTEGVLFAEIKGLKNGGSIRSIMIVNGVDDSNRIGFYLHPEAGKIDVVARKVNVNGFDINITGQVQTDRIKIAVRYKTDGTFQAFLNGVLKGSQSYDSTLIPLLNRINMSYGNRGTLNFEGLVKKLKYFSTALTDQQLIELTRL